MNVIPRVNWGTFFGGFSLLPLFVATAEVSLDGLWVRNVLDILRTTVLRWDYCYSIAGIQLPSRRVSVWIVILHYRCYYCYRWCKLVLHPLLLLLLPPPLLHHCVERKKDNSAKG